MLCHLSVPDHQQTEYQLSDISIYWIYFLIGIEFLTSIWVSGNPRHFFKTHICSKIIELKFIKLSKHPGFTYWNSLSRCFHSPFALALMAGPCKGIVSGIWKNGGNSPQSCEPTCYLNLILDQPIIKGQCHPIGGHAPHPTDSPTATRLGLCSSLWEL